jgi:hypothetical protein
MEKEEISFTYAGSGVQTLKNCWQILAFVAAGSVAVAAIGGGLADVNNPIFLVALIGGGISFFIAAAVCLALHTVAKTALYQRAVLEHQYVFVELPKDANENSGENADESETPAGDEEVTTT